MLVLLILGLIMKMAGRRRRDAAKRCAAINVQRPPQGLYQNRQGWLVGLGYHQFIDYGICHSTTYAPAHLQQLDRSHRRIPDARCSVPYIALNHYGTVSLFSRHVMECISFDNSGRIQHQHVCWDPFVFVVLLSFFLSAQ